MAAISHVFTITYVAELLGEDEDWLHDLSIDMFPEDGCLCVCRGTDDAVLLMMNELSKHLYLNVGAR